MEGRATRLRGGNERLNDDGCASLRATLDAGIPRAIRRGTPRRTRQPAASELQVACLGELPHRLLLFLRELLGNRDVDLHDQVAPRAVLLDSLPRDAKALSRWSPRRNLDCHLFRVEGVDADF